MYGQPMVHCVENEWKSSGNHLPICAREWHCLCSKSNLLKICLVGQGCDETVVESLVYGEYKRKLHGAVYKFRCHKGTVMEGPDTIFCDGTNWNAAPPKCLSESANLILIMLMTLDS